MFLKVSASVCLCSGMERGHRGHHGPHAVRVVGSASRCVSAPAVTQCHATGDEFVSVRTGRRGKDNLCAEI